ncbi:MAG: S-formylglutathione hydrolase [bacterium]|nr:S-formylglutathione hydrolase [bacterium]
MRTRAEHRAFEGRQGFYEHDSAACAGPMRFSVYLPPAALAGARVPALYFLAGLTCTDETFMIKAGAQRVAAALGLALVACDTSPRATRLPGDDEAWDFGLGAGFYLDATEAPWSAAYRMHTYVVEELPALVERELPVAGEARGIFGHSMGGHGALVLALRHPDRYRSVSAFAPICAPSEVPWGQKAFTRYLGADRAAWAEWDACALLAQGRKFPGTLLVDQGTADKFLVEQLQPERLRDACAAAGQPLELRLRDGYDHSYWMIATFVEEHLRHHARALGL